MKWHGGKHYLCWRIIEFFPEHHTYVEPFGGAASVLLNKPPSPVEVYNDLDERITRLFRVIRDNGAELQHRLSLTPYSELEFNQSALTPSDDEIELARRDFVKWRMSIGGRGNDFSFTLHRVRRGMADVVSGYLSTIDEQLPQIVERLRRVQILNRPATKVIKNWDSDTTLIYCDPPYVPKTRHPGSREVYGAEMTSDDHVRLAEILHGCKSRVVLSGYPSDLYDKLYGDWKSESFEMPNHAAGGSRKARVREVLWLNW